MDVDGSCNERMSGRVLAEAVRMALWASHGLPGALPEEYKDLSEAAVCRSEHPAQRLDGEMLAGLAA